MCVTNPLMIQLDSKNSFGEDTKPLYIALLMTVNPLGGFLGSYIVKYVVNFHHLILKMGYGRYNALLLANILIIVGSILVQLFP